MTKKVQDKKEGTKMVLLETRIVLIGFVLVLALAAYTYIDYHAAILGAIGGQTPAPSQVKEAEGNHAEYEEPGAENANTIDIEENAAFSPEKITVRVDEPINWYNEDKTAHTIVANLENDTTFDTGAIKPGERSSLFSYTKPGTYTYYIKNQPDKTGIIEVTQ